MDGLGRNAGAAGRQRKPLGGADAGGMAGPAAERVAGAGADAGGDTTATADGAAASLAGSIGCDATAPNPVVAVLLETAAGSEGSAAENELLLDGV